MNTWKNDPYELPILKDATYRCSCGCIARMNWFYEGPAYARRGYYIITCGNINCKRFAIQDSDWNDTPAEAIKAWNRRCLEVNE